jgi:hypothetical protein
MSIFRNSFNSEVKGQLTARQDAMVNRTEDNISYLNSRNAWVRMSSSVNVNGTNALARSYILQGGTLNTINTKTGLISSQKQGLGTGFQNAYATKSYSGKNYKLGIRPMPGITNIEVKSKSAYGSLREIVVNFQCWDIHQLEDLELLYMRPGYTVLVEWGWLPYLDNNGKLQTTIKDPYYDIINKSATDRTKIFTDLYQKSKDSDGNYEALYGYVKNYQWSARPDGGYDCQTTVISTGEIIESLKVNYVRKDTSNLGVTVSGNTTNPGLLTDEFEFTTNPISDAQKTIYDTLPSHYQKNVLAGMWAELYHKLRDNGTKIKQNNGIITGDDTFLETFNVTVNSTDSIDPTQNWQAFITLSSCLAFIQKYVIARSGEPLIKLSTKSSSITSDGKPLLCIAHPLQVSVDPSVCLIKSPYWYKNSGVVQSAASSVSSTVLTNAKNIVSILAANFQSFPTLKLDNSHIAGDRAKTDAVLQALLTIDDLDTFLAVEATMMTDQTIAKLNYTTIATLLNTEFVGSQIAISKNDIQPLETKLKSITGLNAVFTYGTTTSTSGFTTTQREYFTGANITPPAGTSAATIIASGQVNTALTVLSQLDKISKDYFEDGKGDSELGIIENIYVNVDFLYRSALDSGLESSDHKEKNEINLYNYLKKIINNIQSSIGNLNTFEIHVDPTDGDVARIIDINYTEKDRRKKSSLFELKVHTLDSTVRSYTLQSQIFPDQSSAVAIGSQVKSKGGGQIGIQNNTLMDFNIGVEDRIMPTKISPKDSGTGSNKVGGNIAALIKLFSSISATNTVAVRDLFNTGKNNLRDLIVYFQSITFSPGANRNIIPTKFSFEMDGIGGIVIGNLFTIPDEILPRGYKGNGLGSILAQTVTGISHTISDGDWKTKIDALTFILNSPFGLVAFNKLDLKAIIAAALPSFSTLASANLYNGTSNAYNGPSTPNGQLTAQAQRTNLWNDTNFRTKLRLICADFNIAEDDMLAVLYAETELDPYGVNGVLWYDKKEDGQAIRKQFSTNQVNKRADKADWYIFATGLVQWTPDNVKPGGSPGPGWNLNIITATPVYTHPDINKKKPANQPTSNYDQLDLVYHYLDFWRSKVQGKDLYHLYGTVFFPRIVENLNQPDDFKIGGLGTARQNRKIAAFCPDPNQITVGGFKKYVDSVRLTTSAQNTSISYTPGTNPLSSNPVNLTQQAQNAINLPGIITKTPTPQPGTFKKPPLTQVNNSPAALKANSPFINNLKPFK